jgi:diguanylate cyclase (GGDEF)-like protein/PAS domain S-box-containing protein
MSKILVIDDNATNRKLLVTLLSSEGYLTLEAVDGSDGLAAVRRERPQLVISDILMPTMDGYEFVKRLRTEADAARTPVIFYTANYHEHEARSLAESLGVIRVLVKPCPPAELLAAVAQALSGAPPPPPASVHEKRFDAEHLRVVTNKLSQKADELRAANARLSALTTLNVQLASERDPYRLLDEVCNGARRLLGARYAVLAVQQTGNGNLLIQRQSGLQFGNEGAPEVLVLTAGVLGGVFTQRRPQRLASRDGVPLDCGLPAGFPAPHSLLAVPISSLSRTYGWLCLADKVGASAFSAHDEHLLAVLGAQVGRIYENGSLYQDLQEHAARLLVEIDERERATDNLRHSEQRFRQVAETIQDVFFVQNADRSQTLYVSPAYERIWGRDAEEFRRDALGWAAALHPDDRQRTLSADRAIAAAFPQPGSLQYRIVRPDGDTRWVVTRLFPIVDDKGKTGRVVGISTDITERKTAEDNVARLNRVYAMLGGINSLIVRILDRGELLREACRLAVDAGGFIAAHCRLAKPAAPGAKAATAGQWPPDANTGAAVNIAEHPLVLAAMRSRQPMVCNDLGHAHVSDALSCNLLAGGCRALAALPLVIEESSVGCLVLAAAEPGVFDEAEMRLLNELRGDIAFALDHIDKAERLNYLAYYDALTGLANRTFFQERLAQHLRSLSDTARHCALIVADIEQFAALNETLGRPAGDGLLRAAAAGLVRCVGDAGLVARSGADEFTVLIPRPAGAMDVTRTVDEWLSRWLTEPIEIGGQKLTLSVKGGIAVFPEDGADAASLLLHAEAALKIAKQSDARYAFYTPQLGRTLLDRRSLEINLRRALENEEFVLHYQPKVDLDTRRLTGAEALIRWQSPDQGLVLPAKFIPVMEETGLIVEVGAWALRQASFDRSRWLEHSLPAPRIAVNVSSAQLQRDDFVRTVATVVKLAGAEAGVDIEVTETLLMEDVENNIEKLTRIRELGVGIALDDFGTGYSSLAYLTKLPIETLKIDRSFVVAMLDDPGAMTLVSTVISLAHALKLRTVAEGVESEEQAKILRLLRCDQMQGYLISKPLTFDAMTDYLKRARS